jgi:hypothetical protein
VLTLVHIFIGTERFAGVAAIRRFASRIAVRRTRLPRRGSRRAATDRRRDRHTKENPGCWTRRRAFAQVRHGSNIQLLPYSLVTAEESRRIVGGLWPIDPLSPAAFHRSLPICTPPMYRLVVARWI